MPELPEVETLRRGLKNLIINQEIVDVEFNWPKGFPNSRYDINHYLIGSKVSDVKRRAKVLLFELNSDFTLVTHLKMTGQLVYRGKKSFGAGHPNDSLVKDLPDRSTRVILTFKGGDHLYFNDQRKFGWMRLMPTKLVPEIDFFKKVGPEPLAANFLPKEFITRFRKRDNTSIKAAILDQTVMAGIGNIYADEVLFGAKIHPRTKVRNISDAKLRNLYEVVRQILKISIQAGGSTDRNFVDAKGRRGSYLQFAEVFRREGEKCLRCGRPIKKMKVAGRGTHYCSYCQRIRNDRS